MNRGDLEANQSLSLEEKEEIARNLIEEWYEYWEGLVYVAFSGGKDSTVLLHQVRRIYSDVPAVFIDTGLEWPEVRSFVKTIDNVVWLKPKIPFHKVIKKYGYPVASKLVSRMITTIRNPTDKNQKTVKIYLEGTDGYTGKTDMFRLPKKWFPLLNSDILVSDKCCAIMKKNPAKKYRNETGRKPYLGMMAGDSTLRAFLSMRSGCNTFTAYRERSLPMRFWVEKDVWDYIKKHDLKYSKIYDLGAKNTGCMFCMFGAHLEKGENRFQMMKRTHPEIYNYCMNGLGCKEVLEFIGVNVKQRPSALF